MKQPTDIGKNLTGIALSPIDGKKMAEYAAQAPMPSGSEHDLQEQRESFARESGVIGTVPPPASVTGLASTAAGMLTGKKASVFIDRLGERLAFERTGTRLYDALLAKHDAIRGGTDGGPSRARIVQIHDEELSHVGLLEEAAQSIGADPTVMSPAADIMGVTSSGILQVLTDPRTTMDQCLHAILIAELADNEGWSMLATMAEGMGHPQLASMFHDALAQEERHLSDVRGWCASLAASAAHVDMGASPPPPAPAP